MRQSSSGCLALLFSACTGSVAPTLARAAAPRARMVSLAAKKPSKAAAGGARGFGAQTSAAAAAPGAAAVPLAGYEALYAWLEAGGASRRVAIADFAGLRGVMATEDIAKGEAAISLPSALAVDLGADASDPLPAARAFVRAWQAMQAARAGGVSAGSAPALGLAPFLDAIPPLGAADVSTPDFFSGAELRQLQWPPLEAEVAERARALRAAADAARAAGELGGADAEGGLRLLNWARWVVLSRVLTVQDALPTSALEHARPARKLLIPLVDMCNHHLSRANGIPSGRVGGDLKIVAARDIARGEQVCACPPCARPWPHHASARPAAHPHPPRARPSPVPQVYIQYGGGSLSNDRLLAEYGFVDGSPPALQLDVQMLARALRAARPPGAGADGSPPPPLPTAALAATTLGQDERLLADAGACPPGSRLAAAVRFRAALKRALVELIARQPGA